MRTQLRRRAAAVLTALVAASGLAVASPGGTAQASTNGTADGAAHPATGLLVLYSEGFRVRCSGTLVTPTVVLSAAHCFDDAAGEVAVTFDSVIAEEPPLPIPPAADTAAGYTDAELAAAGLRSGTHVSHPQYSGFTDLNNWNDVAVVLLDEPVTDIAPAPLAPIGSLDTIVKSQLSSTVFRAVGYGSEVRKPLVGPQKATPMTYPLLRRTVDMPGQKLTPQVLQTNGTSNSDELGETCVGDSGGPVYFGGAIAAVTSYSNGSGEKCRSVQGFQRVDISVARTWLAWFGV
ncbi:trypsin-like serine protease [Marmoricola sp. Leaf446]|uniref:trypsin-like serine protease n=1 Tax=Marmoricola sp. Leaf446 TaxID=1736379 RepID=UPI00190FC5F0|nr:trypsin-like serine protease [Marmoricola sp. Leaf446]